MSAAVTRVSRDWLALRERADAAARSRELVGALAPAVASGAVVHDLGCGTGAMGRWLAPLLPGPQHWVAHDRDADLLEFAASHPPPQAADGRPVTVTTKCSDITRLTAGELIGAQLITASALLDLLTADELTALATVCAAAGCPTLLTLSVAGRVKLTPPDPLDGAMAQAFNDHQRRSTERGRLLGPDAVGVAVANFETLGMRTLVRPSPWSLGAAEAELAGEWLTGWVAAACEQREELRGPAVTYTRRRLDQAAAGELEVTVGHDDLLVRPSAQRTAHSAKRCDSA